MGHVFEKLLQHVFLLYAPLLSEQNAATKADSTYVTLAAKLRPHGIENGKDKTKRFVKFSILLKRSLPLRDKAFCDQGHANEDVALFKLIDEAGEPKEEVVVFDRGLQGRKSFDTFTDEDKFFVTRAKVHTRRKVTKHNPLLPKPRGATLAVTADEEGHLMTKREPPLYLPAYPHNGGCHQRAALLPCQHQRQRPLPSGAAVLGAVAN